MSFLNLLRAPAVAALIALAAGLNVAPAYAQTDAASAPAEASEPAPAPAATDAAVPPPIEPVAETAEIDNPYSIKAIISHGDIVDKVVLVILLIMSIGTWYVLFTKLWEQAKLNKGAKRVGETFWTAGSLRAGADTLPEEDAYRYLAEQGLKASEHHEGTLVDNIDLNTWIGISVQRAGDLVNSRLQSGLAFLATVGSTSPFIGLFGTVWGILNALTTIGLSGQASIDKVAGPVGAALIMTAVGLAVAVPAVIAYNWLVRRNKVVMEQVRRFQGEVHNVLLAGKR